MRKYKYILRINGTKAHIRHSETAVIPPNILIDDYIIVKDKSLPTRDIVFKGKYNPKLLREIQDIEIIKMHLEWMIEDILEVQPNLKIRVYDLYL